VSTMPDRNGGMATTHDHIVKQFDVELQDLKDKILRMAAEVEGQIRDAIRCLTERDAVSARRIASSDTEVNLLEMEIDENCIRLLALRQPAATDLRFVAAALKINTDLERMGDLAVNIAERALALAESPQMLPAFDLSRIAIEAQEMLKDALDAFVYRDVDKAERVLERDNVVDELFVASFRTLADSMKQSPDQVERALGLLFIAKHLERIADHATNISEMVVYLVRGTDVRHRFSVEERAHRHE